MKLLKKLQQKVLPYAMAVITAFTSVPFTATKALAAAVCSDAYSADSGAAAGCAARRIGGVPVAYPTLQWAKVSDLPSVDLSSTSPDIKVYGSKAAIATGSRSAEALGLDASAYATLVSLFPANVPFIYGRYNPMDSSLQIDIFKLEKTRDSNGVRTGLYHATFGPNHGDYWKAARAYISPSAFKGGTTPGVNPFASFRNGTSDTFKGISLSGAQVAIGHAMRFSGAPSAFVSIADTRLSQQTFTSGGWFSKKTEVVTYGHAKSRWLIAQPPQFMKRSTTMQVAAFCATDPNTETCNKYEIATSGVSFEEFSGGVLSNFEDKWEIDRQSSSGLSFLGALVIGVALSFALPAALGAMGMTTTAVEGLGTMGSLLTNSGIMSAATQVSLSAAIGIEAAYVGASLALISGANLSSTIKVDEGLLLGTANVVKGSQGAAALPEMQRRLNNIVAPRTQGDFSKGGNTLTGFAKTVYGSCSPDTPLKNCVGTSGFISRPDQYDEHNMANFLRDNDGAILKDGGASISNY